jgi:signal transduction histidine kinase
LVAFQTLDYGHFVSRAQGATTVIEGYMSQLFRIIRVQLAGSNTQLLFANAVIIIAACASVLTALTSPSPEVVRVERVCIYAWLALALALNWGVPEKVIAHIASLISTVAVLTVSWYSGGIYSSTLAWMAVLMTGNYFVVSRRAAVVWLLIYIAAHIAMVFSVPWFGVGPPLSAVSLAQGLTALVDSTLVSVALVLVILFYHYSDLQSQGSLERRQEELGRETAKLKSLLSARERFLSVIGGEITQPLLAIERWSQGASARYAKAPNALMVVEYNIRSALQCQHAVNELLQYSRLSTSQISAHRQYVVLRDALRTLVERLQAQAGAGGREYALDFDDALPIVIYTDKDLFVQALEKLVQCAGADSSRRLLKIHAQAQSEDVFITMACETDRSKSLKLKNPSLGSAKFEGEAPTPGLAWPVAQSLAELLGARVGFEGEHAMGWRFWIRLQAERKQ